jgi:hypothetical protein
MKSNPTEKEKDPQQQSKTFDQLPSKNKELELIKDQAEKSIGEERVALNKKIRAKSGQPEDPKPS